MLQKNPEMVLGALKQKLTMKKIRQIFNISVTPKGNYPRHTQDNST